MRNHTPVRILSSKPDEPALIPQKIPLISLWMARTSSNMSPASYSHEGDLIPTWGFTHQNAFSPPEWWVLGYVWDRPHPQVRFFLIPYDGFLIPDEFFSSRHPSALRLKRFCLLYLLEGESWPSVWNKKKTVLEDFAMFALFLICFCSLSTIYVCGLWNDSYTFRRVGGATQYL